MNENLRRIRRIARETRSAKIETQRPMSAKEMWRSKQYDHVQSKVKQQLDEVRVREKKILSFIVFIVQGHASISVAATVSTRKFSSCSWENRNRKLSITISAWVSSRIVRFSGESSKSIESENRSNFFSFLSSSCRAPPSIRTRLNQIT